MGAAGRKYGEEKNSWGLLVGKLEGKRPPERNRHRWKDNISVVIKK